MVETTRRCSHKGNLYLGALMAGLRDYHQDYYSARTYVQGGIPHMYSLLIFIDITIHMYATSSLVYFL